MIDRSEHTSTLHPQALCLTGSPTRHASGARLILSCPARAKFSHASRLTPRGPPPRAQGFVPATQQLARAHRHGEGRRTDLRAAARWLQRTIRCLREPRCLVPGVASTRAAGSPTRLILGLPTGLVRTVAVLVRSGRGVACVCNTF